MPLPHSPTARPAVAAAGPEIVLTTADIVARNPVAAAAAAQHAAAYRPQRRQHAALRAAKFCAGTVQASCSLSLLTSLLSNLSFNASHR